MSGLAFPSIHRAIGFLVLLLFTANSSIAADADGSIKIRLSGQVATNIEKRITVTQIEAIGTAEVEAYNPYEKKIDNYTGVWLDQFIGHFATPEISQVTFSAIDDYKISFAPNEWQQMRILIATRVNGSYIGYDQKGPMRIVFPDYNSTQKIYQDTLPKWMWMINKAVFK
jgi:hypothetical protein